MNNRDEMNAYYESVSMGTFPYLSNKNCYIVLEEGIYAKHKSRYRGVADLVDDNGVSKVVLAGYYHVPFPIIVAPEGLKLESIKHQNRLEELKNSGKYKVFTSGPSLKPLELTNINGNDIFNN